jgi:integrase
MFLFPSHRIALAGNKRVPHIYDIHLDRAMSSSSYRTAFENARRKVEIHFGFYDARHTFVTRLTENSSVSEETIRQLTGHASPKMLGRYAHIRAQARRQAIADSELASTAQIRPIVKMIAHKMGTMGGSTETADTVNREENRYFSGT